MTSRDVTGMSLDDIIRLNKRKNGRTNGSVTSRGTLQRRGGRVGHKLRGRGGMNVRGRGGDINRGSRGSSNRGFRGSSNRGFRGRSIQGQGIGRQDRSVSLDRGETPNRGRGGGIVNRGRGRGTINRGRGGGTINRGRGGGTINRGRGTGTINRGRGGGSLNRGRGGRNQSFRGQRGLQRQGKQFHGNQNITNSFRSDQIVRQQVLQQKLNRARNLKQNSVSGASDMLTVCIPNELATKRRRGRSSSIPRFGNVNRGSFMRRSNSNSFLNRQSLDRLNVYTNNSNVASPEGSVVTTISRQSRASSVGRNRNRRSSSLGREIVNQNQGQMAMDQYLPSPPWQPRRGLNMQLQKEIAAIQKKTYVSERPTRFANGSSIAVSLSEFRPVPTLTGTTLNERFS